MVVGILALAAGILVGPGLLNPEPTTPPRPTPSPDPHLAVTGHGTFEIRAEPGAIVIRRIDGTPVEVGRAPIPAEDQPTRSGDPIAGSMGFVMACPAGTSQDGLRLVFGSLDPTHGFVARPYAGPPATGQIAPDGLFLFVLTSANVPAGSTLDISAKGGSLGLPGESFAGTLVDGKRQGSGCFVSQ